MEEQNHFVNDSEMGYPPILSVVIYFAIHISMYIEGGPKITERHTSGNNYK